MKATLVFLLIALAATTAVALEDRSASSSASDRRGSRDVKFNLDDLFAGNGIWKQTAATRDLGHFAKGCTCAEVQFMRSDSDSDNTTASDSSSSKSSSHDRSILMNLACKNQTAGGKDQWANSTLKELGKLGHFKFDLTAKKTPAIPAEAVKSNETSSSDTDSSKKKSAASEEDSSSSSSGVERSSAASASDSSSSSDQDADLIWLGCTADKDSCLWVAPKFQPKKAAGENDTSSSDDKKGAAFVLSKNELTDDQLSAFQQFLNKSKHGDVGTLVKAKCTAETKGQAQGSRGTNAARPEDRKSFNRDSDV